MIIMVVKGLNYNQVIDVGVRYNLELGCVQIQDPEIIGLPSPRQDEAVSFKLKSVALNGEMREEERHSAPYQKHEAYSQERRHC